MIQLVNETLNTKENNIIAPVVVYKSILCFSIMSFITVTFIHYLYYVFVILFCIQHYLPIYHKNNIKHLYGFFNVYSPIPLFLFFQYKFCSI